MSEPLDAQEPLPEDQPPGSSLSEIVQDNLARRARCEELEIEILTSAAQINAANYHFITMLAEFG